MTQALYAHINNKKKKKENELWLVHCRSGLVLPKKNGAVLVKWL
jgi:hypothetical protein